MNKKKIIKFILSSAMVFGVTLPMGQVSADTLEKSVLDSNPEPSNETSKQLRLHAGSPSGASIDWKVQSRYRYWEDGYYVERVTYVAYPNGKAARKVATSIYTNKSKATRIYYSASTYGL
ncbi:hypothetical protein [Bacillus cereus]|uniref:hypothetical protein n=1 Tax=Bacillus cereus TaxID=1396 RepID=UPI000C288AF5|nr:hypothetical protein [Bacillus cereus]